MSESIQIAINTFSNAPGVHHIDIKGRIDAYTVSDLEAKFDEVLGRSPNIILTLSEVDYVNSTGVGLLVKYHDKALAKGGNLILTEIPDKVEVVFNMLGLLDFFNVYQTIEDSVKALVTQESTGSMPEQQAPREINDIPPNTVNFPLVVRCLVCQKNLKFDIRGYYRCPSCSCHYIVTDDGKARGFKNLLSRFAELRVPGTGEFFDTAIMVTKSIIEKTNLPNSMATQTLNCVQKLFPLFTKAPKPTIDLIFIFNQTSFSMGFLATKELCQTNDASVQNMIKEVQKMVSSFEITTTNQGGGFCRFSVENQ